MRSEVDPANPAGFHPQAAVFVFSGISYTAVHAGRERGGADRAGADRQVRAPTRRRPSRSSPRRNVPVYFASVPISRDNAAAGEVGDTPLGKLYATLPARHPGRDRPVHRRGAGRRVARAATPTRFRARRARRAPGTGRTAPRPSSSARPTGAHFCPVAEVPTGDSFRLLDLSGRHAGCPALHGCDHHEGPARLRYSPDGSDSMSG